MKKTLILVLAAVFTLFGVSGANAQQASSRLGSSYAKLMMHVSQYADEVGQVRHTARLGPLSYSSKQGFGLNAATTDISGKISFRVSPLPLSNNQTVAEVQTAANSHFAGQKTAVSSALAQALRNEGAATGWFAYEQPVRVSVNSGTGATTQLHTLTWFVFVDQNGAGVAADPKLIPSSPLVLEVNVFPSNSEVNLSGYASGLPQGILRFTLKDAQTGNAISEAKDVAVGSAFDLSNPDNTPDTLMGCIVDSTGPSCVGAPKDVSILMDETGAASAVVRYIAPPTIVYDLTSPQPNADGTYNYRERMTLNVTERVLDYQSSCTTPTHRNTGKYNVTLQSNLYQYVVTGNRTYNRLSANPFTFLAFAEGGKPYQLSQQVAASEESSLQSKIINPLRPTEYLELGTVPNVTAVALNVLNKKEFCERTCDFPSTSYSVGSNSCATGAVSLPHKGQGVFTNTKQDFLGTVSYSCNNGMLQQGNASCEYVPPKKNCAATTLTWPGAAGAMCSSPVSSTLHSGTRSLTDSSSTSSTDGSGSANFICNDGVYQHQSSNCSVTYVAPEPQPEPEPAPPAEPTSPAPGAPGAPGINPDGTPPNGELSNLYRIPAPAGTHVRQFGTGLAIENGVVFATTTFAGPMPRKVAVLAYKFNGQDYQEIARYEINNCITNPSDFGFGSNNNCAFDNIAVDNGVVAVGAAYASDGSAGTTGRQGRIWVLKFNYATNSFSYIGERVGTRRAQALGSMLSVSQDKVYATYSTSHVSTPGPSATAVYRVAGSTLLDEPELPISIANFPRFSNGKVIESFKEGGSTSQGGLLIRQLRTVSTSPRLLGSDGGFSQYQTFSLMTGESYRVGQSQIFGRINRINRDASFALVEPAGLGKTQPENSDSKARFIRLYSTSMGLNKITDILPTVNGAQNCGAGFLSTTRFVVLTCKNSVISKEIYNFSPQGAALIRSETILGVSSAITTYGPVANDNLVAFPEFTADFMSTNVIVLH